MYIASYNVEGSGWIEYYRGSAIDPESLEAAVQRQAPRILADLIHIYTEKLRAKFGLP